MIRRLWGERHRVDFTMTSMAFGFEQFQRAHSTMSAGFTLDEDIEISKMPLLLPTKQSWKDEGFGTIQN